MGFLGNYIIILSLGILHLFHETLVEGQKNETNYHHNSQEDKQDVVSRISVCIQNFSGQQRAEDNYAVQTCRIAGLLAQCID